MSSALILVVAMVFSLYMLIGAASVEAKFHKTMKEVTKDPGRVAECAKGDTKVVRKVVSGTIKHAKEKYKIASLLDPDDEKRSQKEMYDFLNWKLGAPSAVCGQYITGGQKHFNNGYSDEAAASLLGLELPGSGRAEFKLSKASSKRLKEAIKGCTGQPMSPEQQQQRSQQQQDITAQCKQQMDKLGQDLQKEYGIPPELVNMAAQKVSDAAIKGVPRIGFNMPKSWDVETNTVERLIADRKTERAAR